MVFLLVIHSDMSTSFIYFHSQVCHGGKGMFSNHNLCTPSRPGSFSIWYFLSVHRGVFLLLILLRVLGIFSMLFIPSVFFMITPFPYFAPKLICFPSIRLLVYLSTFSLYLLVVFSFLYFFFFFECPVLSVLFDLMSVYFSLPSFTSTFLIYLFESYRVILIMLFCSFRPNIFSRFSSVFAFLLIVTDFLFVFPV